MKVQKNTLLLLACLVWGAAGFNILRIGLMAYPAYVTVVNLLLSAVVFGLFQRFVFGKLVKKHTGRIAGMEEKPQFFLKFFDGKAFAIMAVMMTGGIGLRLPAWRRSGLSPCSTPVWGRPCCWRGACSAATTGEQSARQRAVDIK